MAVIDSFTTVSDGDQLNDGWFNGAYNRSKSLTTFWLNDDIGETWDSFDSYSSGTVNPDTSNGGGASLSPSDGTGEFSLVSQTGYSGEGNSTVTTTFQNTDWSLVFKKNYSDSFDEASTQPTAVVGGTSPDKYLNIIARQDSLSDGFSSVSAITRTLTANKNTWVRGTFGGSKLYEYQRIYFDGTTIYTHEMNDGNFYSQTDYWNLLIIAKGSDVYDIYFNGTLMQEDYAASSDPQVRMYCYAMGNPGNDSINCNIVCYDVRQSKE